MHPYATDSDERISVLLTLFLPAAIATLVILWSLSQLSLPLLLQSVIASPTLTGTMFFLYKWIDRNGWRVPWLRQRLGIAIPDLNGDWDVTLKTLDPNAKSTIRQAKATINQTWSKISILIIFGDSHSSSHTGTIVVKAEGGRSKLIYTFQNKPNPNPHQPRPIHEGVAELLLTEVNGSASLEGAFYTNPGQRGNFGPVTMSRMPSHVENFGNDQP